MFEVLLFFAGTDQGVAFGALEFFIIDNRSEHAPLVLVSELVPLGAKYLSISEQCVRVVGGETREKFKIDSSLAKLGMNGFSFTVESLLTMNEKDMNMNNVVF